MLNLFSSPSKPVVLDLFCGLWGWSEGFIANGWNAIGIDMNMPPHIPDNALYCQRNVLSLTSAWLRDLLKVYNIRAIVASPPCQEFSYMSMPWSRAKQIQAALLGKGEFPVNYNGGSRNIEQLTRLFRECFRVQRDLCELAGRRIPLVIENVKGAQKWLGKANSHFGSFYLWGDVPALPTVRNSKNNGGSWFNVAHNTESGIGMNPVNGYKVHGQDWNNYKKTGKVSPHWRMEGIKVPSETPSASRRREQASALIAKIPFSLSPLTSLSTYLLHSLSMNIVLRCIRKCFASPHRLKPTSPTFDL